MGAVGQRERVTQSGVVELFRSQLGYDYLGDWRDREDNANIETGLLAAWLKARGVDDALIGRALHELQRVSGDTGMSLYDRNRAVYGLLRYGVKVQPGAGENHRTVWLIDWQHPENNHFAIAEEVTVRAPHARANGKRPDIVLYVNGIALGILELKRSTVAVAEGIRQNLDNQQKAFIQPFFSTMQWVMAGNESEGLRYGTIETPEKYYLTWHEDTGPHAAVPNLLHRHLLQLCGKARFLELVHDFVVFDAGTKKVCRQNQFFGVHAARQALHQREGGIIWHTQGSGKSLTMVWLAKWIREHNPAARVLIITDRTELDEQIEKVFRGVEEDIYRTTSGADLLCQLASPVQPLLCSLIHKFGGKDNAEGKAAEGTREFIRALQAVPPGFTARGDIHVFVDECHRTQSGDLHRAMKALLPNAIFIGFTGTPLLKTDKPTTLETFGRYLHTYKYDQAVREGVVLDLRYEARDIEQWLSSPQKVDQWFEANTKGLTDYAKAQLKARWGTMERLLSSRERLDRIVADILFDMQTRPRLLDGHGNAMLVAGSIYEACKFHELFARTELAGKCAIITSYVPTVADTKGETTGEGETDNLFKYGVYAQMLADWFGEAQETAIGKVARFEQEVKKKFTEEPGQMKLLIVVDKLLTGFDAPSATYLYIDKRMRDHGLFQAICRVNRLDGESKEYGYIIDYKDLFKSLEGAVRDYTSGAFDGYAREDVQGLLENRLEKAREDLEHAREAVRMLCEPVPAPRQEEDYRHYFCAETSGDAAQLKENEPRRLKLYKLVGGLLRAYANLANELEQAGYDAGEIGRIRAEVEHYTRMRDMVRLASGDYIDLKAYEPAMRRLLDTYIRAADSEAISAFDDLSLIQLIVERGPEVVEALPESIRNNEDAAAETIENNVVKLIINETPVDPAYYANLSHLLNALIDQRRAGAISYREYLEEIARLTRLASTPGGAPRDYPATLGTAAQRALYNNLGRDEVRALTVDGAIRGAIMDDWWNSTIKTKRVQKAIRQVVEDDELTAKILELAKHQHDYHDIR